MKRKDYQKPTMDVVKLINGTHLLLTSDQKVKHSVQDYEWQTEGEE